MVDEYKKFIGVLILVIAAAVSVFVMKTYYPEFYDQTIQLTLAGDIDGLGDYISSFGYGAFAVSIGLLIFCNVFGIPTIPFLTVNGALFGLIPGLVISWLGEVLGIEADRLMYYRDWGIRLLVNMRAACLSRMSRMNSMMDKPDTV